MIAEDHNAPVGVLFRGDPKPGRPSSDQTAEPSPRHPVEGKRPRLEGVQAVKVDANGVSNFHARHREIKRLG
jgi:hypothetical protein